jgi:hypothetical protein
VREVKLENKLKKVNIEKKKKMKNGLRKGIDLSIEKYENLEESN